MSDTPRTDAAYFKLGATMYDLAGECKLLERELTALRSDNLTAHKMACAAGIERDTLRDEIAIKDKEIADLRTEIDNLIEENETWWHINDRNAHI